MDDGRTQYQTTRTNQRIMIRSTRCATLLMAALLLCGAAAGVGLPTRNGRAITLGDLAFHRSGLPDPTAAGAAATIPGLERALRRATLRTDIGAAYTYSRLGIDLLGVALSGHLQLPVGAAIRSRILAPLAITDIALPAGHGAPLQVAVGHDASGRAVRRDAIAVGGWSGCVTAVARLMAAAADTGRGPLASTFALIAPVPSATDGTSQSVDFPRTRRPGRRR